MEKTAYKPAENMAAVTQKQRHRRWAQIARKEFAMRVVRFFGGADQLAASGSESGTMLFELHAIVPRIVQITSSVTTTGTQ
ncbi:hypothetical protein AQ716_09400 [Burkholderia pseudomallei]|nr:hypothetical protein AQ716_09400 [Burkholderia pseudomallei]